jgi:hypothetical protein
MLTDLKPEDVEDFAYEKIVADRIVWIYEHKQMAVFTIFNVDGQLNLEGTLVIRD